MMTGPGEACRKILALNVTLAIAVYFIQPDIIANYKNSLDRNYQVKKDLKKVTQNLRDYIFRSESKTYPFDPRVINLNRSAAGMENVADNWADFNSQGSFILLRSAGEKFKDTKMKVIFIERKEFAVNPDGRWASFEDGSIRFLKDEIKTGKEP